jgi:predicted metalloprotease with PDZ domain
MKRTSKGSDPCFISFMGLTPNSSRLALAALLLLSLSVSLSAQAIYIENQIPAGGVQIDYAVTIKNPISHLYDVEMDVKGMRTTTVSVSLPAWEPGAYSIRDFAKNVQDFRAVSSRNQPLTLQKADKLTWQISKAAADDVVIHYQVFSNRLSDDLADISGPSLFMYVNGEKHVPVSVKYNIPGGWKVYTGLDKQGDRYHASDYDIFVDAPAFIGEHLKVLDFDVDKIPHRIVLSQPDISMIDQQVTSDMKDIVEAAKKVFDGKLPYKDYTFLVKVQANTGSGGIEHLNSTRITVGENDFVNQTSYRRFLFVVAHEYFHLWNVKRIRPKVLGPFDYTKEANTHLLWVSEGITSYYADVLLNRADIASPQEFLDKMGTVVNTLQHAPGRNLMSAEEASWETWSRSDNSDNNTISYYDKGELIGLLLDIEIRSRTKNAKSLDDVMRYLKANYADKGVGFPEDGFLQAVETVAGSDFKEFFEINAQSRKELNYDRYLKLAGWQISVSKEPGTIYAGVEYERNDAGMARVKRVVPGSPAEKAKLDTGDVLVAINGERLTYDNFRTRLHSHKLGETLKLTLTRGERLLTTDLTPVEYRQETWNVAESPEPTPQMIKLRNLLLGVKEQH